MCLPLKGESHLFIRKYHAETKALAKDIQRWVAILEYNAFFSLSRKIVDSTEKVDSHMMEDKAAH